MAVMTFLYKLLSWKGSSVNNQALGGHDLLCLYMFANCFFFSFNMGSEPSAYVIIVVVEGRSIGHILSGSWVEFNLF